MRAVFLAVMLGSLALISCGGQPSSQAPPVAVIAGPANATEAHGHPGTLRYPVEVLSRYSNALSFRVGGKLVERRVRLGDPVRRGDVVARLDPLDARKQSASAAAAMKAADHRLAYAKQQLERDEAQSKRDLIPANQLELSQDNFAAALAARDQAEAQLALASNNLAYNTLTAEHDGLITSENADTGQVVSAGQAVYGLAWSGDTDVILDVAASDVGLVHVGEDATVTFPALQGQSYAAKVREVSPAADTQSRTYRAKLTLLSPGERVRLGMTGEAQLAVGAVPGVEAVDPSHVIVTLPVTALFHQGARTAVWVIRTADSTLELRPVTVARYGSRSVLLSAGLKPDEMVVLAGVHTVFEGQHVKAVAPLFSAETNEAAVP